MRSRVLSLLAFGFAACSDDSNAPVPTTGFVNVTAATSGSSPDPDGYTVVLDAGLPGAQTQTLAVNGQTVFSEVPAGPHTIELQGVAAHCAATPASPQSVTVAAGENSTLTFSLVCDAQSPGTGSLGVVASTSGRGLDPDGYIAVLDPGLPGSESGRLDVNGSVVFPTVAPGEHTVELGEVADHCVVSPSGPQAVSVSGGQHSFVAFSVLCSGEPFPSNRIAFASDRDGFSEIYVMDADGSNQTRITHDMGLDLAPAFAPDAQHIAFETAGSQSEIFATYADGTGPVKLTHSAGPDVQAAWSPDGSKIAFMSDPHDGSPGIFVMNSDGSDRHRVTSFKIGDNPSWSPDGSRIVFETGGHDSQIEVMNADGSQRHTIALINGHHPAWSPDGGLIAFDVDYPEELAGIVLIEPDGRPAGWVTRGSDALPTWSPDSRRIAFQRSDGHDLEIFVIDVDGTNLTQLTHNKAADTHPSWSR